MNKLSCGSKSDEWMRDPEPCLRHSWEEGWLCKFEKGKMLSEVSKWLSEDWGRDGLFSVSQSRAHPFEEAVGRWVWIPTFGFIKQNFLHHNEGGCLQKWSSLSQTCKAWRCHHYKKCPRLRRKRELWLITSDVLAVYTWQWSIKM